MEIARSRDATIVSVLALVILVACASCVQAPAREVVRHRALAARAAEAPECRKLLKPFAMGGDAEAQGAFADCLYLGIGGAPEPARASQWYKKAANRGNLRAQSQLGIFYSRGLGSLPKDLSRAVALLMPAAEAGQVDAQAELGRLYRVGRVISGTGLEPDAQKAKKWLGLAADQGHVWATSALGALLVREPHPIGMPEEGVKLLRAIAGESPEGAVVLGSYLLDHAEEGETETVDEAVALLEPLAGVGEVGAMLALSMLYRNDGLGRVNYDLSYRWAERAAKLSDEPRALSSLAYNVWHGIGVEKDLKRAHDLQLRAAKAGVVVDQLKVGVTFLGGAAGVPRDLDQAIHWLRLASKQGRPEAPALLQQAIRERQGASRKWRSPADLRQAAEAGNSVAMVRLGEAYATGSGGFARNKAAAMRWLRKAAELDAREAYYLLGYLEADWPNLRPDRIDPAAVSVGTRRALPLWEKAWAGGDVQAAEALGFSYVFGFGVPSDPDRGLNYFRAGADRGDSRCQYALGQVLFFGDKGVVRDQEEGRRWLEAAAAQDHKSALLNLAALHHQGTEIPRDLDRARELAERAAALGSKRAKGFLREMAENSAP